MATIILKGTDKKLECSLAVCSKVNELKSASADPKTPLEIDGVLVELGDIRYAIPDGDKDKEIAKEKRQQEFGDMITEYNRNFREEIRRYALGDINKKIHFNMEVAKMYAFAITGSTNLDGVSDQLIPIFTEELKTSRLVVNPTKYLRLFKSVEVKTNGDIQSMEYLIRSTPFRLMENYLVGVMAEVNRI